MPLTIGDRIAHYNVTALIGEGGMGMGYQAEPAGGAEDPSRVSSWGSRRFDGSTSPPTRTSQHNLGVMFDQGDDFDQRCGVQQN